MQDSEFNAESGEDESQNQPDSKQDTKPKEDQKKEDNSMQDSVGIPNLNVNKYSSRLDLENAGLALGIDEKKMAAAASQEALWKLVKNADQARRTVVSVEEEGGKGHKMKQTVKHCGLIYKAGQWYELPEEVRKEFFEKFYI